MKFEQYYQIGDYLSTRAKVGRHLRVGGSFDGCYISNLNKDDSEKVLAIVRQEFDPLAKLKLVDKIRGVSRFEITFGSYQCTTTNHAAKEITIPLESLHEKYPNISNIGVLSEIIRVATGIEVQMSYANLLTGEMAINIACESKDYPALMRFLIGAVDSRAVQIILSSVNPPENLLKSIVNFLFPPPAPAKSICVGVGGSSNLSFPVWDFYSNFWSENVE